MRADDFPLDDFRAWVQLHAKNPKTGNLYASIVRAALRAGVKPDDLDSALRYAKALPSTPRSQFGTAWRRYLAFLKESAPLEREIVPDPVLMDDTFVQDRDAVIGATLYVPVELLATLRWQNVNLDFEPYGLVLPAAPWVELRATATGALRKLKTYLERRGAFEMTAPVLTTSLVSHAPMSAAALYKRRRALGYGKAEKGDVFEKIFALMRSAGVPLDQADGLLLKIRDAAGTIEEARVAPVVSINRRRGVSADVDLDEEPSLEELPSPRDIQTNIAELPVLSSAEDIAAHQARIFREAELLRAQRRASLGLEPTPSAAPEPQSSGRKQTVPSKSSSEATGKATVIASDGAGTGNDTGTEMLALWTDV